MGKALLCKRLQRITFFIMVPFCAQAQDIAIKPYSNLSMPFKKEVTVVAFANDDPYLLSGDSKGNIECWNLKQRAEIRTVKIKSKAVFADFTNANRAIVAVDKSGNISIFDLLTGKLIHSYKTEAKPVEITIDAGKQFIAVATTKQRIDIIDLKAGMLVGTIDARKRIDNLLFLGFNRLGEQLIAITERAKVFFWNPSTQRLIRELSLSSGEIHGSKSIIHCASTNRSSNTFVIGLQEVALPKGGLRGMARPGNLIRNNMILAYDWNSGIEIKRVKYPYGTVKNIELGPGNDHVAITNNKNDNITLVDLRKGEIGASVIMSDGPKVFAISDDDRWLAGGTTGGNLSVWELSFKEKATAQDITSSLPSLSGRIRTKSQQGPALAPGIPVTLAILHFEAKGMSQNIGDVGLDILTTSLANFDYVRLVERQKILMVLDELKLQFSGLTEESGAQVGNLLNADKVLLCSVGGLGKSYIFTARIVDVETARVEKGRQVICEECSDQDFFDAINLLASTIAQ